MGVYFNPNNESFTTAINRAIQITNEFSYSKEFVLSDEMFDR